MLLSTTFALLLSSMPFTIITSHPQQVNNASLSLVYIKATCVSKITPRHCTEGAFHNIIIIMILQYYPVVRANI